MIKVAVPDKMVGMIIGKGGEQITRLQQESGNHCLLLTRTQLMLI